MGQDLSTEFEFSKEELDDLIDKVLAFVEILCARSFYTYQKAFARAICTDVLGNLGNTLSGLFSRQSGKSETVANTGAGFMVLIPKLANLRKPDGYYVFPQLKKYRMGFWIGIFSPSTTQSSTTFKRLRDRITSTKGRQMLESPEFAPTGHDALAFTANSREYIELNNGSFCLMMSADKQANIESKTFHLILLDESQDLDDFVVGKSIMPMGAHTHATSVATGTPGTTKGFFYKLIDHNKRDEISKLRIDKFFQPQLHFRNDYKKVQKEQPDYAKYIKKEKKRLGEDSDEFQMAYNLKWLLERGMAITEELFDELTIKSLNIQTENRDTHLVAGLDWGKGSDSTVLTIGRPIPEEADESGRCPVEVINWWERLGDDYETIFADLKRKLDKYSIETLAVDSTGVGEPLADRLIWELPNVTVLPVKFTSQSKDHMYKNFLLMLQEKKCWWPGHHRVRQTKTFKMFKLQMLDLQKEYKNNYLTCHAPEDQRNAHDDFPDALALMMWCVHEDAMPFIQVSDNKIYQGKNWNNWDPIRGHRGPGGNSSTFSLRGR